MANIADRLTAARISAGAVRMRWRHSLNEGMVTPDDLVNFAATTAGSPLRKMRLSEVLASLPDWSPARANIAVSRLRMLTGVATDPSKMTVSWLLDGRTERSREWALVQAAPRTPHAGYPFHPEVARHNG